MAKETAEQKLLKLIESSGSGSSSFKNNKSEKFRSFGGIKTFNRFLTGGIVVVIIILGFDVLAGMKWLEKEIVFELGEKKPPSYSEPFLSMKKSLSQYIEVVSLRNIFQPEEKKTEESNASEQGIQEINKLVEKYKLVGVSWLDSADTASIMIENKESGTTYFVKEGEQFEELTVKTIFAQSVIISYKNEETLIKL